MFIVHVQVHVKPECVDAFREATLDNARHSVREAWRDAVADMMAEPRTSAKFTNAFPDDEGWG